MDNDTFTFDVNEELRKIQSYSIQNKISNFSRISRTSAANLSFTDKNKIEEVKRLIRNYAQYWGETEENTEEYINDQLAAFPLDDLISCFRSLNADIQHLQCPSANVANIANLQESN